MLPLLLALSLTAPSRATFGTCSPEGPVMCSTKNYASFEFAPSDGVGMGAACSCAAVTGAKGEVMTFTRASSGTCLKGNTASGIANGDMVTCSTDQPRVMPGGDGTGGLGLLVEGVRTNLCLRSQELDNAAWTSLNNVVAAPTVTADAAVQPDGTTTAERLQIPATSGVQYSVRAQAATVTGAASASCMVKGNASADTTDICLNNNTAGSNYNCAACAFVAGSYTRCKVENVANAGANGTLLIGNATGVTGGLGSRNAVDIFVSDCQWEVGAFASSYIATAGAGVQRAEDLGYFAVSFSGLTTWSGAVTAVLPSARDGSPFFLEPAKDTIGSNRNSFYWRDVTNAFSALTVVGGGTFETVQATGLTPSASNRFVIYYDGTNQTACANASCTTNGQGYTEFPVNRIALGNFNGGGDPGWSVIKRACFDPSMTRCR